MNQNSLRQLLEQVKSGAVGVDDGLDRLKHLPFEDLSFAKVDHHRALRCGFPEVIYCQGKTTEQIAKIFEKCAETGANVLATRADQKAYEAVRSVLPKAEFYELARCITLRQEEAEKSAGTIAVVSAGTADLPVAEEACVTAEIMDQTVVTYYDVGVAGLHRLLAHTSDIQDATVVIVAAGMEGALPSVVGGLVSAPVIAVPTSVGYGASFGGLAALLGMLNSCANNIAVVNIDNGFGAGYLATVINRLAER
jgi:NCAIR mutase (PurE)-related protein